MSEAIRLAKGETVEGITYEEDRCYFIKGKVNKVNSGLMAMFGDFGLDEMMGDDMDMDERMGDMDDFDMSEMGDMMGAMFNESMLPLGYVIEMDHPLFHNLFARNNAHNYFYARTSDGDIQTIYTRIYSSSFSRERVSAFFSENADGKYIRVSLRSKGRINVNKFAVRFFNGGGHRNASGGRLYMPLADVPAYFEAALDAWPDEEKFS